jgi:peptide/nickel transport system permease protein
MRWARADVVGRQRAICAMTAYVVRRLMLLPLILFGVTILIFAMLTQVSPTQRAALYVSDVPKNPMQLEKTIAKYGLNDPVPRQYTRWLSSVSKGDLGFSRTGKQPVALVVRTRLPATAELALWAIVPILVLGIGLGTRAALRHNQMTDHVLRVFSIVATSTPTFVAGLLLLLFLASRLGWFPTGERLSPEYRRLVASPAWTGVTGLYTIDALINGRLDVWRNAVHHLVLPVITLAYISFAVLVRVTRSSMLETLRQDYVRTAQAKGVPPRLVINKHARRNALLPVVTIGGALLVGLISGAAITESVFNWPGMGKAFVDAAMNLDVVAVLGFTVFNATALVLGNLVVDVLYAYLDPRVRLG